MGIVKDIIYKTANKRFLKIFKNQTIFPYYHIVRDNQVSHIENLYQFKNCKQFLNDIDLLRKHYNSINPKDLLENKNNKNSFLLSFDDGLQEVYTVIYPILKKHNLTGVKVDNATVKFSAKHNIRYKNQTLPKFYRLIPTEIVDNELREMFLDENYNLIINKRIKDIITNKD